MAKPFHELRERLLRAGVAPRHVRRYLIELSDHLADLTAEEERAGRSRADAESAALNRLGGVDELARAMMNQRQFQSWCVRAPWAMFGLAPVLFLAVAWFVALFILWSGWQIFLPGAETPFVRINGLAILYFGFGKMIYFGAPIFVGWGIALIAARQRLNAVWPAVGLALIAWMGGTEQVHARFTPTSAHPGHVGLVFLPGTLGHGLVHAFVLLSITALPYLIWRLQEAYSRSA